ncbi:hypothetical protein [Luteolibacter luteus]|uniref:Uncharacterized protein n=1 Tax=Luteolibacter luteus TaxID=2728835 RepID=A0A858RCG0_9BACT|nr:hypothetical protein [Luteolibacter luteus]QJE94331.1 hypothetical protein HHL09_00530 [Luteolibacter luteus]
MLATLLPLHAAELVYEGFNYPASAAITAEEGGSGWNAGWTQDGDSGVASAAGMTYTDSLGNVLDVSGLGMETTGAATTRNFRTVANGPLGDVWISFLYQLPASNSLFEGITFYRGSAAQFAISNTSVDTSATITLGNSVSGANASTHRGIFGSTHFVVLHLIEGGGTGGADKVEAFIDPAFSATPSVPDASIQSANLDFDTIRIAGQNGATLFIDEFRIGSSFADVSPHTVGGDPDTDGDGLTDNQETVLGLDPFTPNTALIAAIKANPAYFGLFSSSSILSQGKGGIILPKTAEDPVGFTFEVQRSTNLSSWSELDTFSPSVALPAGKNFLRVTFDTP